MDSLVVQFNEFEKKLQNPCINSIPCWHVFRMAIYDEVNSIIYGYRVAHPDLKMESVSGKRMVSIGSRFIMRRIKNCFNNPLKVGKPFLISCGARKSLYKGRMLNRCTAPLIESIPEKINYIEKSSIYYEKTRDTFKVSYTDGAEIKRLINQKSRKYQFSKSDKMKLEVILNELDSFFSISLDHNKMIYKLQYIWNGFCTYYNYYKRIIPRLNPRLLVEVDHYSTTNLAFTKIAHENSIRVAELQHGEIDENHVAYNYKSPDDYTPDYFFTFGEVWERKVKFPTQMITVGNAYLEESKKMISKKNNRGNMIILSQGPYAKELINLTVELLESKEFQELGINIIYKLHPNEYHSWKDIYPELIRKDIRVIDKPNESLYELFSLCSIQIGVDSTAIYEGIAFDLKTMILQIDGVRPASSLLEVGCSLVANSNDVIKQIKNNSDYIYKSELIWQKNAKENLISNLKKLANDSCSKVNSENPK